MTADDILNMEAGPELDNLFFQYVMKFQHRPPVMTPSRSISDAWMGLEKIQKAGGEFESLGAYLPGEPLLMMNEHAAALAITRALVCHCMINE